MTKAHATTQPKGVTGDVDVLALITDWHTTLDLQLSAGELSAITRQTHVIGMGKFLA